MNQALRLPARPVALGPLVVGAGLSVMFAAAALAGWAPIGFSIVTVFLFAGPHNWIEARYFFSRLPARWGRLRAYFLVAFGGVFSLAAVYAALLWLPDWAAADVNTLFYLWMSLWDTAVIAWLVVLIQMRSRQNPRRDWGWTTPVALLALAAAWQWPNLFALVLVYAHPLMALWIFDRELTRRRVPWRGSFRLLALCLPAFVAAIWWRLADSPSLPGDSPLSEAITQHAGAFVLPGVSSHLLVATHTFLELVHYAVWLIAIPLVGIATAPWNIDTIPLARRSLGWRTLVAAVLIVGLAAVVALWGAFLADYPLTRTIYFTVALLHVFAEVPFLLRAL